MLELQLQGTYQRTAGIYVTVGQLFFFLSCLLPTRTLVSIAFACLLRFLHSRSSFPRLLTLRHPSSHRSFDPGPDWTAHRPVTRLYAIYAYAYEYIQIS